MSLISPILRSMEGGRLGWWCPGCDRPHHIAHGPGDGPRWTWNGSADKPTFSPSVAVSGHSLTEAGEVAYVAWCKAGAPMPAPPSFERRATVCHSFVIDGQMQMLGDCTHALAGQTVPIPPWPWADES